MRYFTVKVNEISFLEINKETCDQLKNKNPTIFILLPVMNLDHNSAFLEVFVEQLIQSLSRP